MNRLVSLLLCLAACPSATLAQEPDAESLPQAVAQVVQAARDSGAFERRVLGTRYLHCAEEGREALLQVTCRYFGDPSAPEPTGIEIETALEPLPGDGRPTLKATYRVGLDGALVESRCEGLLPQRMSRAELAPGAVVTVTRHGDQLQRTVTHPDGTIAEDTLAWSADALPGPFVSAVLAPLFDQGLALPLAFRLFNGLRLEDTVSTLSTNGVDERGFQILRVVTRAGPTGLVRYALGFTLEGEAKGQLVGGRFDVLHRDAPLFKAVSAAEAEALRAD